MSTSDVRYFEVISTSGADHVEASQLSTDENGMLFLLKYVDKENYSIPQLTTVAVWAPGRWSSIKEITKEEFEEDV